MLNGRYLLNFLYSYANFLYSSCVFNIKSPKTAYPSVGLLIKTCVIAPINLPFCTIGAPLIPCIIPPVKSSSFLSVTFISMLLLSILLFLFIFIISTSYSFLMPFSIARITFAGPTIISSLFATGILHIPTKKRKSASASPRQRIKLRLLPV